MVEPYAPDPQSQALSQTLQQQIQQAIQSADGFLSFYDYMQQVLYSPGLGYYNNGSYVFGPEGDFITAPEFSPLFGATLAEWLTPILQQGCNQILEFGAGSGRLAADIIQHLEVEGTPLERYAILEVSGDLRVRQEATLNTLLGPERMLRVQWLDALPNEPFKGIILANEVLDAMPVEVFRWSQGQVWQRGVTLNHHGVLTWAERPAPEALATQVQILAEQAGPWPDDYLSEWRPAVPAWTAMLAGLLERGLIWIADYGYPRRAYYSPERSTGTLVAYHRQQMYVDPLQWPGLMDLTASVDFTAIAEAASAHSLDVLTYAAQGEFLLGAGLPGLFEQWVAGDTDPRRTLEWAQQVRMLTLPGEMGERFQVMVLGRGCSLPPQSTFPDRRERL